MINKHKQSLGKTNVLCNRITITGDSAKAEWLMKWTMHLNMKTPMHH